MMNKLMTTSAALVLIACGYGASETLRELDEINRNLETIQEELGWIKDRGKRASPLGFETQRESNRATKENK